MCCQSAGEAVARQLRLTQRHFMRKTQNLRGEKVSLQESNTQMTNTFLKQQWQQAPVHSQLVMFQGTAMPGKYTHNEMHTESIQ